MSINGHVLKGCDISLFKSWEFEIIVVTGSKINFCGHILLKIGGPFGYYVHVPGPQLGRVEPPHYLSEAEYKNYLVGYRKKELLRKAIHVPYPMGALRRMEQLLSENWNYLLVTSNCVTFVEEILKHGRFFLSIRANCPIFIGLNLRELE